jgi:hypothetical protein
VRSVVESDPKIIMTLNSRAASPDILTKNSAKAGNKQAKHHSPQVDSIPATLNVIESNHNVRQFPLTAPDHGDPTFPSSHISTTNCSLHSAILGCGPPSLREDTSGGVRGGLLYTFSAALGCGYK